MTIIYLNRVNEFAQKHAETRKNLATWKWTVENVSWKSSKDVLFDFPRARLPGKNMARFEIVHNKYHLVAYVDYADQLVEVRFIGSHAEYDRIDPASI